MKAWFIELTPPLVKFILLLTKLPYPTVFSGVGLLKGIPYKMNL